MKRPAAFWISIAIAVVAGFGCGRLLLRAPIFRDELAEVFDRGRLLALVNGKGVYQADLNRQLAETTDLAVPAEGERTKAERETALIKLIVGAAALSHASGELVPRNELTRQVNLLRFQFGDEKTWNAALHRSELSMTSLARIVRENLKIRTWISKEISNQMAVNDDECREFYDAHLEQFFLPERRNVAHLFLAAPPETPPDVIETKRVAIEALSVRLAAGEDFTALVAQNSEDEATKLRGGELGYFSAGRMPPDFVEAAAKLKPGEISKPVRTRLGFHILKLIALQAPRQQTFDEVRSDIAVEIANHKRQIAVEKLSAGLAGTASYLRPL